MLFNLLATLAQQGYAPPPAPAPPAPLTQQQLRLGKAPAASVEIADAAGARQRLGIVVAGDRAELVLTNARGNVVGRQAIATTDVALTILQVRALEPLWASLLAFASADLTRLRDLQLKRAEQAFRYGIDTTPRRESEERMERRARARFQYSQALVMAGRRADAIRLLEDGLANAIADDPSGYDALLHYARIGLFRFNGGDRTGAQAAFDKANGLATTSRKLRLNVDVNRAAYLAESGRHAEALRVIEAVEAGLRAERGKGEEEVDTLGGAFFELDWIRSCALHGLGRAGEAESAIARLKGPVARPQRVRGAFCRGDSGPVAEALLAALAEPLPIEPLLLGLQPGFKGLPHMRPTLAAAARQPVVASGFAAKLRVLPEVFRPALDWWGSR